jgi:hypothetical protein
VTGSYLVVEMRFFVIHLNGKYSKEKNNERLTMYKSIKTFIKTVMPHPKK